MNDFCPLLALVSCKAKQYLSDFHFPVGTQVNCFRSGIVNENDCGEALVGLDGMQRANSTLEDFVSTSPLPNMLF